MFIETYGNGDAKYLRIVKSIRITNSKGLKTSSKELVHYIGPLSKFDDGKPNYLQRLKDSFNNGDPIIPELKQFCEPKHLQEYSLKVVENDPDCIGHPRIFSNVLIEKFLEEFGLIKFITQYKDRSNSIYNFDLLGFFRLLIYGRILNPSSKIATTDQYNDYYLPILKNPYKYNIYDTLDFIYEYRNLIINKLNQALTTSFQRTTNTIYYDVTNFFFEIEQADEDLIDDDGNATKGLRQYGVSKENRRLPIVQMGLFMDEQGVPISIETFAGNTLDHLTVIKSLSNTIDNLNLSRYIFVGDRGMCSYKNICHLLDHNNGYIISKSIEKSTDEEKAWIMNQEDYIAKNANFKYKYRIQKKIVVDEFGKKREIKEIVVVYWSKKFYDRQIALQKSFIDLLNKVLTNPKNFKITSAQYNRLKPFLSKEVTNDKTGEKINIEDIKLLIDKSKIENYIGHLGYYQIVSSEVNLTVDEILETYHGLTRIEEQFKIMKGDLSTRPLFVRTPEHIYSHLLICMISLIILRLIQNKIVDYKKLLADEKAKEQNQQESQKQSKVTRPKYWEAGLSCSKIIKALNLWTVDKLPNEYYRFNNLDDKNLQLILKSFNINIPTKLFRIQELKHIKQTINLLK